MTTAHDSGKVVSLSHRPPLPPGNTPGTHFWDTLCTCDSKGSFWCRELWSVY